MIEVRSRARHLRATEIEDRRQRRVHPNAAGPSASLGSTERKHTVAEIAKLVIEHAECLPGVADFAEIRFDARASPVASALDGPRKRRKPLEVRPIDP